MITLESFSSSATFSGPMRIFTLSFWITGNLAPSSISVRKFMMGSARSRLWYSGWASRVGRPAVWTTLASSPSSTSMAKETTSWIRP